MKSLNGSRNLDEKHLRVIDEISPIRCFLIELQAHVRNKEALHVACILV
jgi:hypothetical protein